LLFTSFATSQLIFIVEKNTSMSHGFQVRNQSGLHYVTFQMVQWADLFTRQVYRDIVVDSLRYCQQQKGLEIYAFVIMSNHVHLLARSQNDNLSDIIRDFKRHTSKQVIETIQQMPESRRQWLLMIFRYAARGHKRNNEYRVWTHESHAEEIFSNTFIEQKIDYIHNNPVRSGIVVKPEDYLYSSARNYAELDGVLNVTLVTKRWKTV
jgi:REP element-mobilizing transposase RayT